MLSLKRDVDWVSGTLKNKEAILARRENIFALYIDVLVIWKYFLLKSKVFIISAFSDIKCVARSPERKKSEK